MARTTTKKKQKNSNRICHSLVLPGPLNGLTRGFTTLRATFNDLSATVSAKLHGRRINGLVCLALA